MNALTSSTLEMNIAQIEAAKTVEAIKVANWNEHSAGMHTHTNIYITKRVNSVFLAQRRSLYGERDIDGTDITDKNVPIAAGDRWRRDVHGCSVRDASQIAASYRRG